jgi:hypothetical protein
MENSPEINGKKVVMINVYLCKGIARVLLFPLQTVKFNPLSHGPQTN